MTTREEFDAWWHQKSECLLACDADDWEDVAFRAWQASRAATLEEAAKECEMMQKHFDTQDAIDAAEQCAMGIRALNPDNRNLRYD